MTQQDSTITITPILQRRALRHGELGELSKVLHVPVPGVLRGSDDSKVVLAATILPCPLPSPAGATQSLGQSFPPGTHLLPGA